MLADEGLQLRRLGRKDLDRNPVAVAHLIDEIVGLLPQAAAIDRDHPDPGIDPPGHVEQHHPLGLEAGGDGELPAIAADRPAQEVLRRAILEGGGSSSR